MHFYMLLPVYKLLAEYYESTKQLQEQIQVISYLEKFEPWLFLDTVVLLTQLGIKVLEWQYGKYKHLYLTVAFI